MWLHKLLPLSGMGNSDQLLLMLFIYASINSTCAQPPPPLSPQGHCGAFAHHVSPGGGAFANFALPGGRAFANLEAIPKLLTRTRFLLGKKQIGASVKDRNKLKRVVNACPWFYAAFLHCLSSQNYIAKIKAIDVNQRFLVIESNFC